MWWHVGRALFGVVIVGGAAAGAALVSVGPKDTETVALGPLDASIRVRLNPDSATPTTAGNDLRYLISDYVFCYRPTGEVIRVPQGYMSDNASVPFWDAVSGLVGAENVQEAAIIHDWLYAIGEPGRREEADQMFLAAMKARDVNPVVRRALYLGVRWLGEAEYGSPDEWRRYANARIAHDGVTPEDRPSHAAVAFIQECLGFDHRAPQYQIATW